WRNRPTERKSPTVRRANTLAATNANTDAPGTLSIPLNATNKRLKPSRAPATNHVTKRLGTNAGRPSMWGTAPVNPHLNPNAHAACKALKVRLTPAPNNANDKRPPPAPGEN